MRTNSKRTFIPAAHAKPKAGGAGKLTPLEVENLAHIQRMLSYPKNKIKNRKGQLEYLEELRKSLIKQRAGKI